MLQKKKKMKKIFVFESGEKSFNKMTEKLCAKQKRQHEGQGRKKGEVKSLSS